MNLRCGGRALCLRGLLQGGGGAPFAAAAVADAGVTAAAGPAAAAAAAGEPAPRAEGGDEDDGVGGNAQVIGQVLPYLSPHVLGVQPYAVVRGCEHLPHRAAPNSDLTSV